jgi:asparagine synthase (glutamine-hydrolysing)
MCGIAGFTASNKYLVEEMVRGIKWRGPDAQGSYIAEGISMGHTRLSILDLMPRSNQPMVSSDGRYFITYNGEIYNYKFLKTKYLSKHSFRTESDTEVILELFVLIGPQAFSFLSGMFAIAIWDSLKSELFIARDRSGIKPLYYSLYKSILYFCSSPIVIANVIERKSLNLNALSAYARFGYCFGEETFFDGINCFPSGKYAVFSSDRLEFFNFSAYESKLSELNLYDLHHHEIEKHLISDCGVGVLLSGGVDSSILAHHSVKFVKNLNTYTACFSGKNINNKFNTDAVRARDVSSFLGTNHHEINIDTSEVPDLFNMSVEAMTSPISNPTAIALFQLSKYACNTSKVVLSGDGNDELFAGYDRYILTRRLRLIFNNIFFKIFVNLRHKNNQIDKRFDLFYRFHGNKDSELYPCINFNWANQEYVASSMSKFYFPASAKSNLDTLMKMDRDLWLKNFSFLLSDNITMHHNIELRVPFISDEIVNFSEHLPLDSKIGNVSGKNNLRKIYENKLPTSIFGPKFGFMSPSSEWLRNEKVKSSFTDILNTKNHVFDSLYNKAAILSAYDKHISKEKYNLNVLWSIFVLKRWMDFNNFTDIAKT